LSVRNLYIIVFFFFIHQGIMAQDTLLQKLASPFSVAVEASTDSPAPLAGDSWGDFTILNVEKENTGEKNLTYKMLIVAYDTGIFSFPTPISTASGKPHYIRILAPSEEEIKEYAPIKELEFTPQRIPLWKWILFFGGLIVLGWLLWYLWKKQNREIKNEAARREDALAMLIQVKEDWKQDQLNSQQLGDGLVNSLRMCYRVNTKRSTGQLQQAIKKDAGERLEPTLTSTLNDLDAWRFGKREASKADGFSSIAFIETLIGRLTGNTKTEEDL
jgi:hypothetical protein